MTSSRPASSPAPQAQVLAFLDSSLPFGSRPRRIDTHVAVVFLTQDRAWKLKRAVQTDYLNFTTPVRRRAALEAELRLNQRTAPDMYRGVHPVVRGPDGRLSIGGQGEVLDWVLEMRRFPDDALLSIRARAGLLDTAPLMRLAERLADFHDTAEVAQVNDGARRLREVVDNNFASMANYRALLDPELAARLHERLVEELVRHAPRLNARAQAGRVRHGHGDLHLGNIILIDGEAMPFDCLEFDADLATVDVLYDLAFLLMDLWAQNMHRAANEVFNRYIDMSPVDEDGAALMPMFMSMRAAIRAHILAAQGAAAGSSAFIGQAHARLLLAHSLLDQRPTRVAAVGGLPGSDKHAVVRALAETIGRAPGARVLNGEIMRKRLAGVRANLPMPVMTYAPESTEALYREIATVAGRIAGEGHSVVADAVFGRIAEREAIGHAAHEVGVPFAGMWVQPRTGNRLSRVAARRADANDMAMSMQTQNSVGELGGWLSLATERSLDQLITEARAAVR